MSSLEGKTIVLGVAGGIAAYKAAELARLLVKRGARVRVAMTAAALNFVGPMTFQALTGSAVATDVLDSVQEAQIGHIALADSADLIILAPATADLIARIATGQANDMVSTVVLAAVAPVLLAPAMNVNMWQNPLVQQNVQRLLDLERFSTVGPDSGELACGWIGEGRLADPSAIVEAAERLVAKGGGPRPDLSGVAVLVTAGPTYEPIDGVRFLGNRSSGKMGFALAQTAAACGAKVTLIAGPVALSTPPGVSARIDVETAAQMETALEEQVARNDVVVMAAAVADYRSENAISGKLARRDRPDGDRLSLDLVPNPDLLAGLGRRRQGSRPYLVGFAAEMDSSGEALGQERLIVCAQRKLQEKQCDAIVANDVGLTGLGFGSDRNAVTVVFRAEYPSLCLGPAPKTALADDFWRALAPRLRETIATWSGRTR